MKWMKGECTCCGEEEVKVLAVGEDEAFCADCLKDAGLVEEDVLFMNEEHEDDKRYEYIEKLFAEDLEARVEALMAYYSDILDEEEVFGCAVRAANVSYAQDHIDEFDVTDGSYLDMTDDPGMRDVLIDAGARPNLESCGSGRFRWDNATCDIKFDPRFLTEVQQELLERIGLDRRSFIRRLRRDDSASLPGELDRFTYADAEAALGFDGERTAFPDDIARLLRALGYDVRDEGGDTPWDWHTIYVD